MVFFKFLFFAAWNTESYGTAVGVKYIESKQPGTMGSTATGGFVRTVSNTYIYL